MFDISHVLFVDDTLIFNDALSPFMAFITSNTSLSSKSLSNQLNQRKGHPTKPLAELLGIQLFMKSDNVLADLLPVVRSVPSINKEFFLLLEVASL
jgi:hypothetical protein